MGTLDGILGCVAADDAILGNIPWDALTPILQMLIAGRFKFVLMGPAFGIGAPD